MGCPAEPGCENQGVPALDPVLVPGLAAGVNDTSAAYDLVLLAHVLTAVVGLVAVVVAGSFAWTLRGALRAGRPVPGSVTRYYRPGVNWVGRVLFAVPVLGIALVAMSGGQWRWSDTWVSAGLAAWAVVAVVAESVVWPGERRLQDVVARDPGTGTGDGAPATCLRVVLVAAGCACGLVAVAVVMVAKP